MTLRSEATRIERALEIFLAWRDDPRAVPAADLLARHADLVDLLEPLVDSDASGTSDEKSK